MTIPLVNLKRMHGELHEEIRCAIDAVIGRGDFALGRDVSAFEEEFAAYCEADHCITTGSGLDALILIMRGLGIGRGDEVITTANTFIATALAIHHTGAMPVLVDHDAETYNLDPRRLSAAITPRTRAIIPVHLYGHPADMDAIQTIADEHGFLVIEDACQAHGARYKGRRCGGLARAAAFSFYPGKNLGAMGDGGAIVTNDDKLAKWLRAARNYGSNVKNRHAVRGFNTRLDTLQAAVLRIKLRRLDEWNETRRKLANAYRDLLAFSDVVLPTAPDDVEHVYHLFVIRCHDRDELLGHLSDRGIGAGLHYPLPIPSQAAFRQGCVIPRPLVHASRFCDEILSLPMCPYLREDEITTIAREVTAFTSTSPAPAAPTPLVPQPG